MLEIKQLPVAIDFHSMGKKSYGSQWLPAIVWLPTLTDRFFIG